jgi:tungstate transport system ATP-binding protein
MLRIVNLYHHYGEREVLRNINLEVERGEVFALIGPTGAGKTTLLRLIDLLEIPTSGTIYFAGVNATKAGRRRMELRRRMAFVLQKPVVFNMSVHDNIAYGLKWRRKKRGDIRKQVAHLLDAMSLSPLADKNARTLSGGEVQRVAIARAMAVEPEILLLDEPTANLDPNSTLRIEELIRNISHQYQPTIIMATHDLSQGHRLANKIVVMVNGKILQAGKADEIFSSPSNREIAEFVGVENIIGGTIVAREGEIATIDLSGKAIEAISDYAVGEEVYACIRPEDITLFPSKATSSARNTLPGQITKAKPSGSLAHIEVDCGFPLVVLVTKRSAEELNLKHGQQVYASFKATAIHVIKKH